MNFKRNANRSQLSQSDSAFSLSCFVLLLLFDTVFDSHFGH